MPEEPGVVHIVDGVVNVEVRTSVNEQHQQGPALQDLIHEIELPDDVIHVRCN